MGGENIEGVKDSKKLSDKRRRILAKNIISNAIAIGYGIIDNDYIDKNNIKKSSQDAMKFAINNLKDKNGNEIAESIIN